MHGIAISEKRGPKFEECEQVYGGFWREKRHRRNVLIMTSKMKA